MTTIGQLITELMSEYETELGDHELATRATQQALDDLLRECTARKQRTEIARLILAAR